MLRRKVLVALVSFFLLGFGTGSHAADAPKQSAEKQRVVLQVSDDNPKTWNQALNVIENLQQAYGKENVDIKLVALGYGIGILLLDSPNGGARADLSDD